MQMLPHCTWLVWQVMLQVPPEQTCPAMQAVPMLSPLAPSFVQLPEAPQAALSF